VRRLGLIVLALCALVAAVSFATASDRADEKPLAISAASSLSEAFTAFDPDQRYGFGGSSTLEAQIRQGSPADLFASASPRNSQNLFRSGLVERPVPFAANRLALIVPKSNPAGLHSVFDLRSKPVELVIAAPGVPAGDYTLAALRTLGLSSALARVVSREADVKAVTGKVALGQADAGFVYVTDARPVRDRVRVIPLPHRAQPRIRYEIAVVAQSARKEEARAWIRDLLSPRGRSALAQAGFLTVSTP
jgi:molybdate transport system substrate-binding protein